MQPGPPPAAGGLDEFAVELLARRGLDRRALDAALAPGAAVLDALVAGGILDRIAARAVALIAEGRLDERDLKQLLDLTAVRARLARLAGAGRPAAEPRPLLPLGGTLGRFPLKGLLGRGASGDVYLSHHPDLRVPVALKVTADPAAADRLRTEAAVLARITDPHVVRVWGLEPLDGWTALVLEYVDGESLARTLTRGGPLAPRVAFRAARDALRGLRAAHAAGVVHGDVKPGNVLGTLGGRFKLADFGTARRPGAAADAGVVEGTWPYTAPECFDGPGDHRADVYSLGLTVYHLLTGRPPVAARGFAGCREAHRTLALEPLHWTVPGVGRRAADLIRRMTAADPDARPARYDDLIAEARRAFRVRAATPANTHNGEAFPLGGVR